MAQRILSKKKKRTRSQRLTSNVASAAPPPAKTSTGMVTFKANVSSKLIRNDTWEGRECIVVPMIMMVEGVHEGSQGALYYPADELAKTPEVWNHKPVVVYHPTRNGEGVSACDPIILDNHKVGTIFNAKFDKLNRLKAEAWIEKSRAEEVDPRILEAIENEKTLELSTGLYTDNEAVEGEWNGEPYEAIARNYRPDHLAILPDKRGACSVEDGAGFCRNQLNHLARDANKDTRSVIYKTILSTLSAMGVLRTNEMSHSNIHQALHRALRDKFPSNDNGNDTYPNLWVLDVYDTRFIFERDGDLFALGYTKTDTDVTISDEDPVPVTQVTEYRSKADGAFIGNTENQNKQTNNMDKKQIVDTLIKNEKSSWTEDDREFLMGLEEDRLNKINANIEAPPANPKKTEEKPTGNKGGDPKEPESPQTLEQYISKAPPEYQELIRSGLGSLAQDKQRCIAEIKANESNPFSDEQLAAKPIEELRQLAAFARSSKPAAEEEVNVHNIAGVDFSGLGRVVPSGGDDLPQPMAVPAMNFGKEEKSA